MTHTEFQIYIENQNFKIHGNPVADGWAGAAMQKLPRILKCDLPTHQHALCAYFIKTLSFYSKWAKKNQLLLNSSLINNFLFKFLSFSFHFYHVAISDQFYYVAKQMMEKNIALGIQIWCFSLQKTEIFIVFGFNIISCSRETERKRDRFYRVKWDNLELGIREREVNQEPLKGE